MATYFISDLHLGASYDAGAMEREKKVVRFLESVCDDADALYLLGDIFDYWYEYRYVVPRGHVRLLGALARLADRGVKIVWLTGNHDIWLFDYLPSEIGLTVVDANLEVDIEGQRFFLAHGDRVGRQPRAFRLIQLIFRNRLCQKMYAAIHPRWTIPFALRWSSSSRRGHMQKTSGQKTRNALNALQEFCTQYLAAHPKIRYFIFGHLHLVKRIPIPPSAEMVVTGDWLEHFSYARFDKGVLSLEIFKE